MSAVSLSVLRMPEESALADEMLHWAKVLAEAWEREQRNQGESK